MSRIKQVAIILFLVAFVTISTYRTFGDRQAKIPTWYLVPDIVFHALLLLTMVLYAIGFKPLRLAWFWRCVPVGFVLFQAGDVFFRPVAFDEALSTWFVLFPAILVSFVFAFPFDSTVLGKKDQTQTQGTKKTNLATLSFTILLVIIITSLYYNQVYGPHRRIGRVSDSIANSDLRNAATAQEAYFVAVGSYSDSASRLTERRYGLLISQGVTVTISSASSTGYTMSSYHASGGKTWSIAGPGGSVTSVDARTVRRKR